MKRSILAFRGAWLLPLLVTACAEPTSPPSPAAVPQFSLSSTLITCPSNTTQETTALIDPLLGGTLELAGHRVEIPAGAITEPTWFTLREPASHLMEIEVRALGIERFVFELPVTVTISYARCTRSNLLRLPLTVWYVDKGTKALLQHMGGEDDKEARTVTFSSGHLSTYAIAD